MSLELRAQRLASAVEAFLLPGSSLRARYLDETPHFFPELLGASLERSLRPWTDSAGLSAAVRAEHGAPARVALVPPERAAVILAGVVAASHVQAIAYPWLLGSEVVVKAPSSDPLFPALFAQALGERVQLVGSSAEAVVGADAAVVVGSDEAVVALRPQLRPGRPFLAFGHRQSVAWADIESLSGAGGAAHTLSGLALDVGLYDQRGCLSVGEVLVPIGQGATVAERLLHALAQLPPRRRTSDEDALRRERELAVMRGELVHTLGDASVRVLRGGALGAPVGGRFVTVRETDDLHGSLATLNGTLSTVVAAATLPLSAKQLARLGASRVVPAGQAQAAGPDWPHDGLAPWAQLCVRIAR